MENVLYIFYRHQLKGYDPLYFRDEENQFNHRSDFTNSSETETETETEHQISKK